MQRNGVLTTTAVCSILLEETRRRTAGYPRRHGYSPVLGQTPVRNFRQLNENGVPLPVTNSFADSDAVRLELGGCRRDENNVYHFL